MKSVMILIPLTIALSGVGTIVVQSATTKDASSGPLWITVKPKGKAVLTERSTFHHGEIAQESTGPHTWKLKNEGEGNLDPWLTTSSDGSSIPLFKDGKKAVLKPREVADVALEFRVNENRGNHERWAAIGTTDPLVPSLMLQVQLRTTSPLARR